MLAFAVVTAVVQRRQSRSAEAQPFITVAVAVLAIVVGVATVVQVVRIGDSGARSVWANELTKSAKP